MPEVSVTINGRSYRMACDAGQEEHLTRLSKELDARIARLRDSFGEIGDTRLTVMAALMVADEVSEMRRRLRAAEQEIEGLNDARHAAAERIEANEKALADVIESAADRIERIAHGLTGRGGSSVAIG